MLPFSYNPPFLTFKLNWNDSLMKLFPINQRNFSVYVGATFGCDKKFEDGPAVSESISIF
jgi:hypothetical protein